jgi:hypothetical protein
MLNDRQNKAMADQLTTVSKQRLINQAGRLTNADMRKVEDAVKVQLGLLGSCKKLSTPGCFRGAGDTHKPFFKTRQSLDLGF